MKRIISAIIASTALFSAQMASAQHTAPYLDPAAPWTFAGSVDVTKGLSITCDFTVTLLGPDNSVVPPPTGDGLGISHTDVANLTAQIVFTNPVPCPGITVNPVTQVSYSGSAFTFHDVYINTLTPGDCEGDIVANWTGSGLTIPAQVVEEVSGGGDCSVEGAAVQTAPSGGGTVVP